MNTHVRERAIFVQSSPAFITRLDAMIEELIAMRDALDGDADDEDDGSAEPTLGAPEAIDPWSLRHAWARGSTLDGEAEITIAAAREGGSQDDFEETYAVGDDCEDGHDAENDRADEEPTLGAPERHATTDSQEEWAQTGGWQDEMEITTPTAGLWLGESQDVDPRACGYGEPDDAEIDPDLEPDADPEPDPDTEGESAVDCATLWRVAMRADRHAKAMPST